MICLSRLVYLALVTCVLSSNAIAQNEQRASDHGVNVGRDNHGFINTGEINIILQSEASLARNAQEQETLQRLSELLQSLVYRGELSVTETGARILAKNALEQLARQELSRNVIEQRQFSVARHKTYNIADTNHRITYIRSNCGANVGITFRFDRDEHCWFGTGGTLDFKSGESKFELVFDGYDASRNAMFTIYPSE